MDENIDMYIDVTPDGQIPPKVQLHAGLMPQAESEKDQKKILVFLGRITDEEAAQLLALDGFTEPIKIPIWDADLDGPAKDAARDHDTPPDRFIDGTTAPRNIMDDLFLLIHAAKNFPDIGTQIETLKQLSKTEKQYWTELQKVFPNLPSEGGRKLESFAIPTGLLYKEIFSQPKDGSHKYTIKDPEHNTITLIYFDFNELDSEITKKLDALDEETYNIIANLYQAGKHVITLGMIYGVNHNGKPSTEDLLQIEKRVTKLERTFLTIKDNSEKTINGMKVKTVPKSSMLQIRREDVYINGRYVEQAILLLCEPPFFAYEREQGHVTTVPRNLLVTPLHGSERNTRLNLYLIRTIMTAKRGATVNRITYATIFEKLGITSPSLKSRTKTPIDKLFRFYMKEGLISDFKQDAKGITFFWDSKKLSGKCKLTVGEV